MGVRGKRSANVSHKGRAGLVRARSPSTLGRIVRGITKAMPVTAGAANIEPARRSKRGTTISIAGESCRLAALACEDAHRLADTGRPVPRHGVPAGSWPFYQPSPAAVTAMPVTASADGLSRLLLHGIFRALTESEGGFLLISVSLFCVTCREWPPRASRFYDDRTDRLDRRDRPGWPPYPDCAALSCLSHPLTYDFGHPADQFIIDDSPGSDDKRDSVTFLFGGPDCYDPDSHHCHPRRRRLRLAGVESHHRSCHRCANSREGRDRRGLR